MSLKTWMSEFYPTDAAEMKSESDPVKVIEHSLKKWTGLGKANLKKHDVSLENGALYEYVKRNDGAYVEVDSLRLDMTNCSLCQRYFDDDEDSYTPCKRCPIFQSTNTDCLNEYHKMVYENDPRTMIALLKDVRKGQYTPALRSGDEPCAVRLPVFAPCP